MSATFTVMQDLSESKLIPNKRALHDYDIENLAELAVLYILSIRILLDEQETKIFAQQYCRKTASNGNFKKWHVDGTDMYVILYGLMSEEARDEHGKHVYTKMPIDPSMVYRWFRAAADHNLHKQLTHQFFLKLDNMFRVKNSSIRSIRRLVMDWDDITRTQRKLALTRLLQFMRDRASKGELLQKLQRVAALHNLELHDVDNPEDEKPVKEGSFLLSLESATAGATGASSVAAVVGGLGAGFDADYSKSVYPAPKKEKKPAIIKRRSINENETSQYLATLEHTDQAERNAYMQFVKTECNGDWEKGGEIYAKKHNRPADDIFGERSRNKTFITKAKTFEFKTFSESDWNNFWLVTQHCDFDRGFQKWALSVITQYQGVNHSHYKYLYDRISCGYSGTQKYGTQDGCKKD